MTDVWAWAGLTGGLMTDTPSRSEPISRYIAAGGYAQLKRDDIHALLSGNPAVRALQGRGGAGFPLWTKLEITRGELSRSDLPPVVVANGAEGEPLSVKDRYLMRSRPHAVLDGVAIAAKLLGAPTAYLYVGDARARQLLETAVREARQAGVPLPEVRMVEAHDTWVAGEATAVVRAIDTGVARPRDVPPHPSSVGVGGVPTLVSNVETFVRLARALQPSPPAADSPLLVTLSGEGVTPAVVEVPYGTSVTELLRRAKVDAGDRRTAIVGGFFGGMLPITDEMALSTLSMREHGGGLGCASLYLLAPDADPVPAAAAVADFYAANNARQCLTCVRSTDEISSALGEKRKGAGRSTIEDLTRWSQQIVGRGACATPDGIATLLRTLLRHYPERLAAHVAGEKGPHMDWRDLTVSVPEVQADLDLVSGVAA